MPQQELSQIIQDIDSRIRSLESKNTLLRERVENINQNSLNQTKKYIFNLKTTNMEFEKIKTEITSIKKILNQITRELKLFAKKEQIKTLEKYIDLLNPKEFITKKELDEILKNKK